MAERLFIRVLRGCTPFGVTPSTKRKRRLPLAAAIVANICLTACDAFGNPGLYQILNNATPKDAWRYIFGQNGERGEYMDGYSANAMLGRCAEDYKWSKTFLPEDFALERANMMAHLYDNTKLWEHVCMVAFAEHYITTDNNDISKPYDIFQRHKYSQPNDKPIFSGVVFSNWDAHDDEESGIEQKLNTFKLNDIDYIRLECNLGTVDEIKGPEQLSSNVVFKNRFDQLANTVKAQEKEMAPLVLLQVPWRGGDAMKYFEEAVTCFATSLRNTKVESNKLIFETRPPMGIASQEERGMSAAERVSTGFEIGQKMFNIIDEAFDGDTITGFCVAGGSTKGNIPTAMEDDTQNAVRQGIRLCAQKQWGYDFVFWEMGAKLMLQPKVGRLWDKTPGSSRRDAARELFCINAEDLADEIQQGLS